MATSGTFTFGLATVDDIITDAFERIGVIPDLLVPQNARSAIRSLNFSLTSLLNRGLNLWTVQEEMLTLLPNQATYTLPDFTQDLLEVTLRQSVRNLNGTAFSSAGGTAANAFDGDSATACTQVGANGYISYQWASQFGISLVGIQSNTPQTYTLALEYSNDNINWFEGRQLAAQSFAAGDNVWFTIPAPTLGTYFRVRETGGATLDIQELYFNSQINDLVLTNLSRSEYMTLPQKTQTGRPSSFYLNRQINPTITLWLVPNTTYNNLFYTRVAAIQDAGQLTNSLDIPRRYLESITADLAYRLAVKHQKQAKMSADIIQMLKMDKDEQFELATKEDVEHVPLRIYGDYSTGYASL